MQDTFPGWEWKENGLHQETQLSRNRHFTVLGEERQARKGAVYVS